MAPRLHPFLREERSGDNEVSAMGPGWSPCTRVPRVQKGSERGLSSLGGGDKAGRFCLGKKLEDALKVSRNLNLSRSWRASPVTVERAGFLGFFAIWDLLLCVSPSVMSTLCDPLDCSPPGSSVHGIFQANILERVAIPFSRASSQPRNGTWVSCTEG